MTDNSRAFIGYDQWKTSEPDDPWEDESPEDAARNEMELWESISGHYVPLGQARANLEKAIWKGCGAYVVFEDDSIVVGMSVPNTDESTDPVRLTWPFSEDQLWDALDSVQEQADEIEADVSAQLGDDYE